jgi:glyoxylate/hydroxypyruvate reductase
LIEFFFLKYIQNTEGVPFLIYKQIKLVFSTITPEICKKAMSIVIIFNNKNPKPWAESLKEKLPQAVISIYPEVENPASVTFAICWKADKNVLLNFPNLAVIQSVGASIDHIVRSQTVHKNQIITRIVDENLSNDMWEFLLAAVMSNLKNLDNYSRKKEEKKWEPTQYATIKNTTISILGLGQIGSLVAKNFAALGFQVHGWSTSEKNIENVTCYAGQNELEVFLKNTDFLIHILPLTTETERFLDKNVLKQIKKGGFLINVGRGEHLVEQDLIDLLDENYLSGALLDVFRVEPLPQDHAFWTHPKIQITPHIASLTHVESATTQIAENYKNYTSGKALRHIVSVEKGY